MAIPRLCSKHNSMLGRKALDLDEVIVSSSFQNPQFSKKLKIVITFIGPLLLFVF